MESLDRTEVLEAGRVECKVILRLGLRIGWMERVGSSREEGCITKEVGRVKKTAGEMVSCWTEKRYEE